MKQISRAKFENMAYLVLNIANVAVYLLVFSGSVLKAKGGTLADIIQSIYCSLGCVIMCEIVFNVIISILAFTLGFTHIFLSLIADIPPPNSFLVHWQNYKDFWAEGLDLNIPLSIPPCVQSSGHPAIPSPLHVQPSSVWHLKSFGLDTHQKNIKNEPEVY
ncbi:hypothetical protein CU098_008857 [Rhizopus stolonifer]|uniref:Uncharacterized protein n=1 Tax=Rhizopus stolonifer TaxID=4846 RepID=A0A367KVP6_RHIST|nr:hypothetical protein CU098_008857 [Rhizopus stolonifer]